MKDSTTSLRMVMRMNKTCYKQYDTRWASLPYPRKPWLIRNCGCGEVSICNSIIEMASFANQTPKSIQPYMKQYAESRGNGTYHYGIPTAMKHYGMTEVSEHSTMQKLWNELKRGNRVAVLLMGSRLAGSKRVKWTGSGHFVAVTAYKEEGGKHWVYVKDSASTSSYRNGWITYEDNIRGACLKCWSGKLTGKAATTTTPSATATPDGKLTIDGIGGISTVKAMQRFFGTLQDGVVSGQNQSYAKYYPALKSVKYARGGSACIKAMQKWLGITQDGVWGRGTSVALQKKLGVTADGIFGVNSMKAWQKYLNEHDKAVYPEKSKGDKIMDACKAQANYMKSAKYGDYSPVTLAHSKTAGTCVTYEGCVFQRLGALASGKYIWHDGKGYGTGKVTHLNTKTMTCTYMNNKTLSSLKSKIQKGDCVLLDDNKSGKKGSGGHVMFCTGEWSGNDPYVWDFEPNRTCAKTGKPRKYSGSRKVLAIARLK